MVKDENDSETVLCDTRPGLSSQTTFCNMHSNCSGFVAEPNNLMKDSYLVLDEYMRFLDKGNDPRRQYLRTATPPIFLLRSRLDAGLVRGGVLRSLLTASVYRKPRSLNSACHESAMSLGTSKPTYLYHPPD